MQYCNTVILSLCATHTEIVNTSRKVATSGILAVKPGTKVNLDIIPNPDQGLGLLSYHNAGPCGPITQQTRKWIDCTQESYATVDFRVPQAVTKVCLLRR